MGEHTPASLQSQAKTLLAEGCTNRRGRPRNGERRMLGEAAKLTGMSESRIRQLIKEYPERNKRAPGAHAAALRLITDGIARLREAEDNTPLPKYKGLMLLLRCVQTEMELVAKG